MIRVGIIGGAGYTAGELLRLLTFHPKVEIVFAQSNSQAGKPIHELHPDLLGDTELHFTPNPAGEVDVLFFCGGHGKTKPFLEAYPQADKVSLIDLSRDFRLKHDGHSFIYGLPELNREAITKSHQVANPGCFATAIQLALLPLADAGMLKSEVHVHAITGSTGAGQQPSPTTHFSWRNNNVSIYKPFTHQHLGEIHQSLEQLQPQHPISINFLPVRGNFSRGIYASAYLHLDMVEAAIQKLYQIYYQDHPFTHLTDSNPNLKQVVGTNKCVIHLQKHGNKFLVISMIDNLLKGAAGQAVQNMNLMFGLEETAGLQIKGIGF
ncbi:MAG: N-acetyl-gamma-glutamyl-phosphate reductase [Bacteroidota bacterium]